MLLEMKVFSRTPVCIDFLTKRAEPMSEEWQVYPCSMEDKCAFISYDHGIRESINEIAPPNLLQVRVPFAIPTPEGLPTNEEFPRLSALEDDLQAIVLANDALFVGRVTVDGWRYFYSFTAESPDDWKPRVEELGARHGYELRFVVKADPERSGYWNDLFPTEDDRQVISDMKILDVLSENGDDGTAVRRVDHWAYFEASYDAQRFLAWLEEQGYEVQPIDAADEGLTQIRFAHEGPVTLQEITSRTISLRRMADELGGNYDGWETPVCKPD